MHDVIICGAGPVGLYLASLLEERLDVLVLDKAPSLGKKADSGLYSSRLEDFLPLRKEWIEHEVSGAVLHSPTQSVTVEKPSTAAHVVDRERFQQWLASRLTSEVKLKTTAKGVSISGHAAVSTAAGTLESRLLVGADGASSLVRKHFGVQPAELVNGLIAITQEPDTSRFVHLYFDKEKIADGFFWKIPRGKTTEYGALGTGVNYQHLETFFGIRRYERRAAFMNVGLFPTAFERALLIGEAAGQVKPWSFGGLVFGFTGATIARDVIFQAFEEGDFSQASLQRYDDRWKKQLGSTIRTGLSLRKRFAAMDNRSLERYFRLARLLPLDKLDMDFPSLELFG